MLEKFYGWIKTIAACLIFMSLILRLLPEGKNVKYIRYFMGMVLVLVVLAPLGRLFRLEEAFLKLESSFELSGARSEFEDELLMMGDLYTEEVIKGYEEDLADQALKVLEKKGYGEYSVQVAIDANLDSETFGQVKQMELFPFQNAEEGNETGKIAIEKKKVQILSEEPSKKNYLEAVEDEELTKIISEEFSIPGELIRVVR